ncbi:MAG: site-specific integrase [Deltaproteobacteria bacterium]|jgi:integrase|nr:site-specific integrase [Deltaproteobacteria bacterium]MCL5880934.1 site-specific integrase [Deltaproteobacteria bacterium]MDA8303598.1 site-specific integrase [Deltaproteobacteria bacterium]
MGIYRRGNIFWMSKTINGILYRKSAETESKMRARAIYEDWTSQLKESVKSGKPIPAVRTEAKPVITFNELAAKYIGFTKDRLKSAKNLEYMVNKMLLIFKDKPLNEFTLEDIEGLQINLINQGKAVRTSNHYPRLLKTMFRKAEDWELVDESVVRKLAKCKNIQGENKRLRYLSEEEIKALIEACEPTYLRPIVITALNTGMRLREILKLTWQRVDLKNRLILLDKTKNGERREIPINETLYGVLSSLVRNIAFDHVFYDLKTLRPFDRIDRSFHTALKKAKIIDFHFHDLRHTFASWLVMKGVDLAAVQKLLGHKSITMTMRYAHLAPGHVKKAVSVLDEKMSSADLKIHNSFTIDEEGKILNP